MGPNPDLQRVQRRRPRLLRHLFRAFPRHGVEAAQVRYPVSTSLFKKSHYFYSFSSPCHPSLARYGALLRQHAHAPNHDRANEPASRPFAHASSTSPTIMGVGVCGAFLCDSLAHSEVDPKRFYFSHFSMKAPTVHAQKTHRRLTLSPDL